MHRPKDFKEIVLNLFPVLSDCRRENGHFKLHQHMKKVENGKTFDLLSSPGHGIPGFSGMLGNTRQREKDKEK